jgi:hypothetical protein
MSEHRLSPDPADWPSDPYALLGVCQGLERRALRVAYAALIRTYKPEQYPEEFRRIREAYETILREIEMFGTWDADASTATGSPEEPADETDPDAQAPVPACRAAPPALEGELVAVWQQACSGEEHRAYGRLLELRERNPHSSEICLRLYWLRRLNADLDPERSPCEWLTQGLREDGNVGPLYELYRREVASDPHETLTCRYFDLLEHVSQTWLLSELVEWRWQAAGRLGRDDVIAADVATLRERFPSQDEESWFQLLFCAVEQLTWLPVSAPNDNRKKSLAFLRKEIDRHEHLHLRFSDRMDRLHLMDEVFAGWCKLTSMKMLPELCELIRMSWIRPIAEIRPALTSVCHGLSDIRKVLGSFDKVRSNASPVLTHLGQLLELYKDEMRLHADDNRDVSALR